MSKGNGSGSLYSCPSIGRLEAFLGTTVEDAVKFHMGSYSNVLRLQRLQDEGFRTPQTYPVDSVPAGAFPLFVKHNTHSGDPLQYVSSSQELDSYFTRRDLVNYVLYDHELLGTALKRGGLPAFPFKVIDTESGETVTIANGCDILGLTGVQRGREDYFAQEVIASLSMTDPTFVRLHGKIPSDFRVVTQTEMGERGGVVETRLAAVVLRYRTDGSLVTGVKHGGRAVPIMGGVSVSDKVERDLLSLYDINPDDTQLPGWMEQEFEPKNLSVFDTVARLDGFGGVPETGWDAILGRPANNSGSEQQLYVIEYNSEPGLTPFRLCKTDDLYKVSRGIIFQHAKAKTYALQAIVELRQFFLQKLFGKGLEKLVEKSVEADS